MQERYAQAQTPETVIKQTAVAVTRCSRDFLYLSANQVYADWIGRPLNEIVHRPILQVLGKDAFELLLPHFCRVLAGEDVHYEQETYFQGIGPRWISADYTPTLDADGNIDGWVTVVVDITERRRAEKALRESEGRFRLAVQAGKMYAYEWNVATDVIIRSGDVAGVLGLTGEASLTREQLLASVHPDDRAQFATTVTERTPEDPKIQITYRVLRPDGSVVWLEKTAHAFFDEGGRIVRMIGIVANITERKQTDEAIRESEMRYRRIVETTNEGVWLLDSALNNSYVNRRMAEMLGYEPEEMLRRSVFDFYFPEDVERKRQVLTRRQQGLREQIEERMRRRDGSELWVRLAATPVFKANGEFDGALAMASDITEWKRAEEAVRESEKRFRLVANTAPVMIWMSGPDRQPTYFNNLWLEFTGQSEVDLQNGLPGLLHSEDRQRSIDIYREAFAQRRPFSKECRLRRHDGEYRWMLDIGVPRFHEDGSFAGYIGSCVDVTEQKLAEEARSSLSRRLIEAHEEERTWIARELHDDVTQRLALLAVSLEDLKQDHPSPNGEASRHIDEVQRQVQQIGKDIQALSHRLHSSKLDYLGLEAASAGFCRELSELQKVEIDFHSESVPKDLPKEVSLCLFRVLQESLQNAVKHSGARHFQVSLCETKDELALTVRDSGVGFDLAQTINRHGLGLTSMKERLKLIDGKLLIDSQLQRGTTIQALVPQHPR
jgi:PAS domain S-box-containing protein